MREACLLAALYVSIRDRPNSAASLCRRVGVGVCEGWAGESAPYRARLDRGICGVAFGFENLAR